MVVLVLGTDVSEEDLIANVDKIRSECGDRAFLRAIHFVNETRRAKEQADALKNRDTEDAKARAKEHIERQVELFMKKIKE